MRAMTRHKEHPVNPISRHARRALCASLMMLAGPAAQAQSNDHSISSGTSFEQRTGEDLFEGICQGCHMPLAQGAVGAAAFPALAANPHLASKIYPAFILVNGKANMPNFSGMLDDQQIAAVVNYVRSHFGNHYTDELTPAEVKALRPKHPVPSD